MWIWMGVVVDMDGCGIWITLPVQPEDKDCSVPVLLLLICCVLSLLLLLLFCCCCCFCCPLLVPYCCVCGEP